MSFWRFLLIMFGIMMVLAGVLGGLYLGIWVMLIGGIAQAVNGIIADPIDGIAIGVGIAKFIFCELGVALPMLVGIPIGSLAIMLGIEDYN